MRILVVTPWFPSEKRPGAGSFILRDVELLAKDHDVTVLHLAERKDVNSDEGLRLRTQSGAVVVRQPFQPMDPLSVLRAVREISGRLSGSDFVHTMALHALLPVRLARPRVPWVHTEHWSGLMQPSLPLKKRIGFFLYRSSLSNPDAVAAVGETLASSVARFRRDSVEIIANHVELGDPCSLPQMPPGVVGSNLRLVAVGNLIHHKGPLEAIESIRVLRERGILASLLWVGTGPLADQARQHARDQGVSEVVEFLGQVSPERIPGLLRQSHMFILPTISETFGVAYAEALGQGLPVVASGWGGHVGFLPPEASRLAVERSPGALADAVVSLLTDPNRWRPEEIMAYAHSVFSQVKREAGYRELYERAARRTRRSRGSG
mgnify:CR=1 FL=1